MNILEWILIGIGLSMDAAAVSVCKGLAACRVRPRDCLLAGVYFGGFQALMPAIGYALGRTFADMISRYSHWISFVLLAIIGINMLRESFGKDNDACSTDSFTPAAMLPLAVATSIDALAVGVTFAFLQVKILPAVAFIGVTTFVLSTLGTWVGGVFGTRFKNKAEFAGGIILVLMGGKILLEHLGILS